MNNIPDDIQCYKFPVKKDLTDFSICLEYCLNNNLKLPFYKIQSANPVGYKNINTLLQNYNKFYETNERRNSSNWLEICG